MLVLFLAKDEVHDDAEDHRDRGAAHLGGEGADRDLEDQAAEQLLNSAQQDEKGVQHKVNKNQNNRRRSLEKDW